MNDYMDNYLELEKVKRIKEELNDKLNYLLDINGILSISLNDINLIDEYNYVFKAKLEINKESIISLIVVFYNDKFYLYKNLNNPLNIFVIKELEFDKKYLSSYFYKIEESLLFKCTFNNLLFENEIVKNILKSIIKIKVVEDLTKIFSFEQDELSLINRNFIFKYSLNNNLGIDYFLKYELELRNKKVNLEINNYSNEKKYRNMIKFNLEGKQICFLSNNFEIPSDSVLTKLSERELDDFLKVVKIKDSEIKIEKAISKIDNKYFLNIIRNDYLDKIKLNNIKMHDIDDLLIISKKYIEEDLFNLKEMKKYLDLKEGIIPSDVFNIFKRNIEIASEIIENRLNFYSEIYYLKQRLEKYSFKNQINQLYSIIEN